MSAGHPAGISVAIEHLSIALQIIDTIDCPAAAAHILSAFDCLGYTNSPQSIPTILNLNMEIDFRLLDYSAEQMFS